MLDAGVGVVGVVCRVIPLVGVVGVVMLRFVRGTLVGDLRLTGAVEKTRSQPGQRRCGAGQPTRTLRGAGDRALRRLRQRTQRRAECRHHARGLIAGGGAGGAPQRALNFLPARRSAADSRWPSARVELRVVLVGQRAGVDDVLDLCDLATQEQQELSLACRRIERGDRVVDGLDQLALNVLKPVAAGHRHRMRSQDRLGEFDFRRTQFGEVVAQPGLQGTNRIDGFAGLRGLDRRLRHSSPPPRLSMRSGGGANSFGSAGRPAPSNNSWACDSAVSTVLTCPSSHPSTSTPSVASQPNPQYGGLSAAISASAGRQSADALVRRRGPARPSSATFLSASSSSDCDGDLRRRCRRRAS